MEGRRRDWRPVHQASIAADRATYEATVVHAGKSGVVMVACADVTAARECLGYLTAYFTDQPQLAALLKKQAGDTIELKGGTRILVTSDVARRPHRMLATITLDPSAIILENVTTRELWRCVLDVQRTEPEALPAIEAILGVKLGTVHSAVVSNEERSARESQAEMERARTAVGPMPSPASSVSVPSIPRPHLDQPGIRPMPKILRSPGDKPGSVDPMLHQVRRELGVDRERAGDRA